LRRCKKEVVYDVVDLIDVVAKVCECASYLIDAVSKCVLERVGNVFDGLL
jgi:hypothetical protein